MPEIIDILNAIVLFANFVLVPAVSYGAQLALGALGITLVYGILRFSNFAHGRHHGLWHHDGNSSHLGFSVFGH